MTPKTLRVFLDTSVIFAAVLSPSGGARRLFLLGEAGFLHLLAGPNVLRESEQVVLRKAPASLPGLAHVLAIGRVETVPAPTHELIQQARAWVDYEPDARVLAEAILAGPDWFVTHDKEHFLKSDQRSDQRTRLKFRVGTPGDLLQSFREDMAI